MFALRFAESARVAVAGGIRSRGPILKPCSRLHTRIPSVRTDPAALGAQRIGEQLAEASLHGKLVEPAALDAALSGDIDAGYLAQRWLIHALHKSGESSVQLAGWKIGATNAAGMQRLGLSRPFLGPIFRRDVCSSPAEMAFHADALGFRVRGVECEFAVIMAHDLLPREGGGDYTGAEVLAAAGDVVPAIEICGSRLTAQGGTALGIADQASHGRLVLAMQHRMRAGEWAQRIGSQLREFPVTMSLAKGAAGAAAAPTASDASFAVAARGDGTDVLGNPLHALTWLANELCSMGLGLRAGDIVSTGTMTGLTPVAAGDVAVAEFTGMGRVRASFLDRDATARQVGKPSSGAHGVLA